MTVNGVRASLGEKADADTDHIEVDGRPLPQNAEKVYIMLNKPRGYVTTMHDEKGRRNVTELLKSLDCRVYPVGRLDMYSEGLLLLTNDGDFANAVMHPSYEITKTYLTWVKGEAIDSATQHLREPMRIDEYMIRPANVEILDTYDSGALLSITIHEGRNRQIRKMCEQAGLQVTRLKRVAEGGLSLGTLKSGEWRYLREEEVSALCHTQENIENGV